MSDNDKEERDGDKAEAPAKSDPPPKIEKQPAKAEKKKTKKKAAAPKADEPKAAAKLAHSATSHAHAHEHKPDRAEYVRVLIALAVLTALEVGLAYTHIGKTVIIVGMLGLAIAKAACVALFYMHLKHETKWMKWTVAFPVAFPALYAFILISEGIYRSLWDAAR